MPLGERAEQAQFASAALGELAGRSSYYRLRQPTQVLAQSLHANENASQTLAHLALIGTAEAQRTLLDFASRPTAPLDGRKAAADQFAESVRLHGVLLTSGQIVRQYDRYNASEFADATTQQILGELLDVIEGDRGQ